MFGGFGGVYCMVSGGYGMIMFWLVEGFDVCFGMFVVEVRYDVNGVVVETKDG